MARNPKKTRMCAGCMKRFDKSELVCVRKSPEGASAFLVNCGSEGRGAYVCPNEKCLDRAIKRKAVSRGLRCEIPADVYEQIRKIVKSENQE